MSTPAPVIEAAAGKISAKPRQKTPDDQLRTTQYILGTTRECPIQNVDVKGITFQRFQGQVTFSPEGNPDQAVIYGVLVELTKEHVKEIVKDIELKVIRCIGARELAPQADPATVISTSRWSTGRLLHTEKKGYHETPHDLDLGRFLYMWPATATPGGTYHDRTSPLEPMITDPE